MDEAEMRELLDGYLRDVDWGRGLTKAELVGLVQDDQALHNLLGQYLADQTFHSQAEALQLIPAQAWQDAQGDAWRGGEVHDMAGLPSHFLEGPVGQDQSDVHRAADLTPPPTPGFGQSTVEGETTPTR